MPRALGPPPYERPNWQNINEGQRRYAMEQWNLARVRRGLTIDHPIPEADSEEEDQPDEQQPEPESPETTPNSPASQTFSELLGEPDDNFHITQEEINQLQNFLNQFDNNNEVYLEDDLPPGTEMSATGPGGSLTPQATPTKRDHQGTPKGTRPDGRPLGQGNKRLPGTARAQGGGPGLDPADANPFPIPRPMGGAHKEVRYYKKVHRFLTYGLAYSPITVARDSWNDIFMMTPLAEIPWDRLFMYLNPSEYNLLPAGASVIEMKCHVRSENVRIAFPTNASNTNLATLNQNKFLRVGHGLRQHLQGVNVNPVTFGTDAPMVTTAVAEQTAGTDDYLSYIENFYGVPNNDAAFLTHIPVHQVGIPIPLRYYYALTTQDNDVQNSGWSDMQQFLKEFEADSHAGQNIASVTYKPHVGIIKEPINTIWTGVPSVALAAANNISFVNGTGNTQWRRMTVEMGANQSVALRETNADYNMGAAPADSINQIIEKCQQWSVSLEPHMQGKTCPSLHVGLQPVIAMSTANINAPENRSYTDSQAYFEVTCECRIETAYPTYRPLATIPNTSPNNLMWVNSGIPSVNTNATMINGLYPTTVTP